jgi:hypothetical protein
MSLAGFAIQEISCTSAGMNMTVCATNPTALLPVKMGDFVTCEALDAMDELLRVRSDVHFH